MEKCRLYQFIYWNVTSFDRNVIIAIIMLLTHIRYWQRIISDRNIIFDYGILLYMNMMDLILLK